MIVETHADESLCYRRTRRTQDVIVDTDIGTDIDDAYALLLAISSPEMNVKGVTLVHGDIATRARIALKLLKLAGPAEVPVVAGETHPVNAERPIYWPGHEGRGIDFTDVESAAASLQKGTQAAEFIPNAAAKKPGELLLITIGPLTNAAIAVRDHPREMACLKGIVCMGSTFNGFGRENAGVEHNIAVDPEAAEIVLSAGIPVLLVGLNVTLQTALTKSRVTEMAEAKTPLARLMGHMTEDWFGVVNRDTTCMHDPLAVAASFEPALVTTVPVIAEVSRETPGSVTYFEPETQSPTRICASVDVGRFHELFYSRILRKVTERP